MGVRRQRLAQRVRALQVAERPAALLREYFAGADPEDLRENAPIVYAALLGRDDQVNEVINHRPRWTLRDERKLAGRIRDARMIAGLSVPEAARGSGLRVADYRRLEHSGQCAAGSPAVWDVADFLGLRISLLDLQPSRAA